MRAKQINRKRERGGAALVAIIFIGFAALTILAVTAVQSRKNLRGVDQNRNKLDEKWNARSNANILAQKIRMDAPKLFKQQLLSARDTCQLPGNLVLFDEIGSAGQNVNQSSRPAAKFDGESIVCTGETAPTSVFGNVSTWTPQAKDTLIREAVERFGINSATTDIVEMNEIYRRRLDNDPAKTAYAVRYIVESKSGNYRTRTNGEYVIAADDSAISCSITVSLEANPSRIIRGSSTTLQATYTAANRLQFFNSADTRIYDENVTMQSDPAVVNYTFSPAATDSYYVVATGAGGCSAQSAPVTVIVDDPPPVCPTVNLFEASATSVSPGATVTIRWDVSDAFEVTLQQDSGAANIVVASGSQDFVINNDTTFTLRARDAGGTCPIVRTITIRVIAVPPCQGPPVINSFAANPSSVTPGATTQLSWSVSGIAAGDELGITGPNGFSQNGLAATGNLNVTVPNADGDYTYTLTATNICPDGTRQTVQQSVIVRVRTCPPPVFDAFTANPSTVTQGGNQIVRLSWSISGTVDSVSINNGVGGSLPASGFVDISQPQTTTVYTITAIGCGQTRQTTLTITVNPPPPTPSESCNFSMPSESICSVINVAQCGPHTVDGNISVTGNTFTFQQTHNPFGAFGQEFLTTVGFAVFDSANRQILSGGWAYNNAGSSYWTSMPAGAGTLYQNSVTVTGTIPAGYTTPLYATIDVGYGANAGYDSKSFNTGSSPGGCGSSGGGSCYSSLENEYYCDEHSNVRFTTAVDVSISRSGTQTTVTITPPPNNKPGYYHSGFFNISNSSGFAETVQFSSDPRFQGSPTVLYYPEGGIIQKVYNGGTGYTLNGDMNFFLDPIGGACTIAGSQETQIDFEGSDACIVGLYKVPEILDTEKFDVYPKFLATLMPKAQSCSSLF